MSDLGGWQQQRELDVDAGLDWLEELREETIRLVEEDRRRYDRYIPQPLPEEDEAA